MLYWWWCLYINGVCYLFIVHILFFRTKAHDFNIKIVILHCFVKTMFMTLLWHCGKSGTIRFVFGLFELPLQISIKDKCRGDASEVYIGTHPVVCKRVYTLMHTFRVYYICLWGYQICSFNREGCGRPKKTERAEEIPSLIL